MSNTSIRNQKVAVCVMEKYEEELLVMQQGTKGQYYVDLEGFDNCEPIKTRASHVKDEESDQVLASDGAASTYFIDVDDLEDSSAGAVSCRMCTGVADGLFADALVHRAHIHDDSDSNPELCIMEDLSTVTSVLAPGNQFAPDINSTQEGTDEISIFRAALQDMSQPTSEATPPDGLLAIPLMKHQRIALSWMVQQETRTSPCSGGILADDQGLGKTISTIALILKERSPSTRTRTNNNNHMEAVNLDGDDGGIEVRNPPVQAMGKPAAGTLIVCPTSVIRQWSEEIHNKVTKKANLSVLTYHGSNRTKDPLELAKYDVVLTTYAIITMEVPKQPVVDTDDKKKESENDSLHMGHPFNKKRKSPPSSSSRRKFKKPEVLQSVSGPLSQVRWFRVVLDEAQIIKNHRTQGARACWSLHAKRRWCLSGTPLQNCIDDLYSYFRFLRYDPYAVFKSFSSKIKVPVQKNPKDGYKKLQAILKIIMLRRTKATILDGEPILNLPPKTIELKKLDFTMEERNFYDAIYKEAKQVFARCMRRKTIDENYFIILVMLQRLRQACNHPFLPYGSASKSSKTSVKMAKKLAPEKRVFLLNCLDACTICSKCEEPPEDAVVSICGHVFCNQCICEYLNGYDNQCPSTDCGDRLSVSSVFSRDSLESSLSEGQENVPDSSGSAGTYRPCQLNKSYESTKIKAVMEVLQSLSLSVDGGSVVGDKALVFSQWTSMLDLLEPHLKNSSINYRRLDGTMSISARDKAVKDFNTQPEVSVIIMSLKAAGLGLNMVAANHVLLLDLWWNPTTEDQAIDRAHRIGQTHPVSVLRFTVKETVEDRILTIQQNKREMVASAFGEDESGGNSTRLSEDDLKYLFGYNH